jgi:Domain of unknown function (DUF5655)
MWTCPTCGQSFVSRNLPHSCQVVALDSHFAGTDPVLRAAFEAYLAAAREHGPVTVNPTKSRISFQARMRFAGVLAPRKRFLLATFVLTRPVAGERFVKVEFIAPYYYVHYLRLRTPADVDDELRGWLSEAYEIGTQRHVDDPGWPKVRKPPSWVRVLG